MIHEYEKISIRYDDMKYKKEAMTEYGQNCDDSVIYWL
jgi:hypothetical protein